ncbi:MAG: hypothetical protein HN519_02635, partial [Hellea sp.]|nr:hypothetical protein [Hellea sp.]
MRGRDWTSPQGEVKYFVSLEAWRLDKVSGGGDAIDSSAAAT